jgi:cytochrome c-type biogenesis protein CcmH/NrfG
MDDRLQRLRDLVAADPDDALTRFLLGREAAAGGHFEEACTAFAAAVERDPKYTAAYRQWGNALEKLGRAAEAAAVYARGVHVAERTGDLQAGKEMQAFLKRLEKSGGGAAR